MIKKSYAVFTIILLSLSLSGCGFKNLIFPEDLSKYSTWERKLLEPHQHCIGMSKEEIQKKYGKPKDIDYNVKHFIKEEWRYEQFDERWGYEFHTGIKYITGNLWWIYFYFKNDRVVKVNMD